MIKLIRCTFFIIGLLIFSLGISLTIQMQHLGVHPWDVLTVGLFEKVGLTIGTWNILIGLSLVCLTLVLDKKYIRVGTLINAVMVGLFVDFFLWLDVLPQARMAWTDVLPMLSGILLMGFGGGLYNAAEIGAGPRDGFMLSISEKLTAPIARVRMITESLVLVVGFLLGGPVFIFSIIFTFIQSPIFQFTYLRMNRVIAKLTAGSLKKRAS